MTGDRKNKICFVIVYFGEFPVWFSAFLLSCKFNEEIDWIIFTDTVPSGFTPLNVKFNKISLEQFQSKASKTVMVEVSFSKMYKLCDFKPLYGDIFQTELQSYHYWGHCDLDLIWGDIKSFLKAIDFKQYDIISSRQLTICGHFTLYRNSASVNTLYKEVKGYKKLFIEDGYSNFDEGFFSYHLFIESLKMNFEYKIYWPHKNCVDWPELDIHPYGWYWSQGKIFENNGTERLYLHFMKWKKTMKSIDFDLISPPVSFKINQYGMWSRPMGLWSTIVYLYPNHLGNVLASFWKKVTNKLLPKPTGIQLNIPDQFRMLE